MKVFTLQTTIPEPPFLQLQKMAKKLKVAPEHAASLVLMVGLSRLSSMEINPALEVTTLNALSTSRTDAEDHDVPQG